MALSCNQVTHLSLLLTAFTSSEQPPSVPDVNHSVSLSPKPHPTLLTIIVFNCRPPRCQVAHVSSSAPRADFLGLRLALLVPHTVMTLNRVIIRGPEDTPIYNFESHGNLYRGRIWEERRDQETRLKINIWHILSKTEVKDHACTVLNPNVTMVMPCSSGVEWAIQHHVSQNAALFSNDMWPCIIFLALIVLLVINKTWYLCMLHNCILLGKIV